MSEIDRKKAFSTIEKELFLSIIQKYDTILTCKQTNATSSLRKKQTWEMITEEFNASSVVAQQATVKQLTKLWYNMKAKARESKTQENIRHLTGGGSSVPDMDGIDAMVMDIDKNILTNIEVDADSDINASVIVVGDSNNEAWCKDIQNQATPLTQSYIKNEEKTPKRTSLPFPKHTIINKIDYIKYKILEEEFEFKQKLHEEELKMKIQERQNKQKMFDLEYTIKLKELENLNK